jgi:hypothetical protein
LRHIITWRRLTAGERKGIEQRLREAWARCTLRHRFTDVACEVLDASVLKGVTQDSPSA